MYELWTRSSLKDRAKLVLKRNYWKAFLVSLVIGLVSSGIGGSSSSNIETNIETNIEDDYNNSSIYGEVDSYDRTYTDDSGFGEITNNRFFVRLATIALIVSIIFLILRLIVGYSLEVGGRKFFIKATEGEDDMGYLLYGFKNKRYLNILKTMFTRDLYTTLWTLLFIIPGIIKSYSYRMVPYILADNPYMNRKRAIEISKQMTVGQKLDIFTLDFSFLGWYILGTFLFFIGVIFVLPYDNATNAELYSVLRKNAIESGITNEQELNYPALY